MAQRPQVKVLQRGSLFQPSLVWEHRPLPLGLHASEEVAQAVYDVTKLLVGCDRMQTSCCQAVKPYRPAAAACRHRPPYLSGHA